MRSEFPDQGPNPCLLHWKHGVLTAGPPGKSLFLFFLSLLNNLTIYRYDQEIEMKRKSYPIKATNDCYWKRRSSFWKFGQGKRKPSGGCSGHLELSLRSLLPSPWEAARSPNKPSPSPLSSQLFHSRIHCRWRKRMPLRKTAVRVDMKSFLDNVCSSESWEVVMHTESPKMTQVHASHKGQQ